MSAGSPESTFRRERVDRLAEAVSDRGIERMLVTDPISIRYLTGFTGTNGACLIAPENRLFVTDPRYREWVAGSFEGWQVQVLQGEWLTALAGLLGPSTGIEDGHMTVRVESELRERGPTGTELVRCGELVTDLRRIKDDSEMELIGEASKLADAVLGEVLEAGLSGKSEAEIAGQIVGRIREEGGEPSFPPIVASGPNSASPHAEPSAREIGKAEMVILDLGARLDGYCSDCTRTVFTGQPEEGVREVYEVVAGANEEALSQAGAGVGCADLDEVARGVIERAGYGDRFVHGLGHGVGLEVHEAPRIGPRSSDVLESGEVVTIEPGIYLPGDFGVRVEDLVSIGVDGVVRNFSSHTKELLEVD